MRLLAFMKTPICHLSLFFSLTLCLAPFCFHSLLYSPLFSRSLHLRRMSHEFLLQSMQEGAGALHYFQQRVIPSPLSSETKDYNKSVDCTYRSTESRYAGIPTQRVPLAITVVTTRRRPEYHYLLQVARGFMDRISECGDDCSGFQLFVCNVDTSPSYHTDACLLSHLFSAIERYTNEKPEDYLNTFEREKQDYAFCLSHTLETFKPEYVMLVEDDAVPKADIFSAFFELVRVRFPKNPLGGGLYVKFYHPERLQGYLNPEPMRILEWIGLGVLSGLFLSWVYSSLFPQQRFTWWLVTAFMVYTMLLAELFGRHYLLELRRILPGLYNMVPATECCTPAMLFSDASARRTLSYLEEIRCELGYAKDTALYGILKKRGEWAWAIEPNMVSHIGLFSTLRGGFEEDPQLL
uniref:Post-GPI attachment to proteins GalNAc transferase 4 n=1 Tax=Leptobrachium leishanense TaxID=445787 RepID=A0A8C5QDU1_9ANUR